MPVIGPGAQQAIATDIKPTLDGASEYEYVTILNPLSEDFAVRVAMDVPVNLPFNIGRDSSGATTQTTLSERDAAQTYGLSLKNPDFAGRKHIFNDTIIPAGKTINLKGSEAQVAVRQLVNEIMQRNGNARLQSDPVLRRDVEEQIVVRRGSVQELMDSSFQTPQQQINHALNQSNEVNNEPTTGLASGTGLEDSSQAGAIAQLGASDASSPKPVGRPKKADS